MSKQVLRLVHEFDARVTISPPYEVGDTAHGHRQYAEVTSAVITGERLKGRLLGSAGDWMTVGPDGYMRMDVRLPVRTDDGTVICVRYFGPAEVNERMQRAMRASAPTTFADQRIRTHWLLESGDARYAWVNQTIFVGESRFQPGGNGAAGFEHRVYRVDRPSAESATASLQRSGASHTDRAV